MTTKEQIKELYEKGASVEEIAEVTNMRMRTVQTTIRMIENEEKSMEKAAIKVAKKTNREIVEELVDKGLGAQEIQKKTGIPIASVYTFSSNYRKSLEKTVVEKEKVDPVKNERFGEIEQLRSGNEKLENNILELESENDKLKNKIVSDNDKYGEVNIEKNGLKSEVGRLKQENVELHIKSDELAKELAERETVETVSELNKQLELLQHNYIEQSKETKLMQEMINEKNEMINDLKETIKSEQKNHGLLFKYMVGVAESEVAS